MDSKLVLYNTLTRRKEVFEPLTPGRVGMYVCGPTVYGDPHLGHARPAVTFDLLFRYLKASGYKVRYVRNITDVGHLEHDADDGGCRDVHDRVQLFRRLDDIRQHPDDGGEQQPLPEKQIREPAAGLKGALLQ